jgi:cystathionine beta-lyase
MANAKDGTPKRRRTSTEIVHSGRDPFAHHGFVNPPVYRGSTVLFKSLEAFEKRQQRYTYGRRGTPTTEALEEVICTLEGGHRTMLAPNGLAAITHSLLAFVKTGDHILVPDSVYQPARKFCDNVLARLGVTTQYYDPLIGAGIAGLMQPNTSVVFTESPGSQTFEVQDIPAIAEAAHKKGAVVMMDNTWASPLYFKPFEHGVDISIQAATKYIVGHADAMLGSITANAATAEKLADNAHFLGIGVGTEECYLGLRGIRTIEVRMERHQKSALDVARWLEARPEVARVIHPGLESHPGHAIWKRDFLGASGLFAFVLKPVPKAAVAAMLEGLELFGMGASWGGFESLVLPFNAAPYRTATKWQPEGPCVRIHIGLEDLGDIKSDLDAGFKRLKATAG